MTFVHWQSYTQSVWTMSWSQSLMPCIIQQSMWPYCRSLITYNFLVNTSSRLRGDCIGVITLTVNCIAAVTSPMLQRHIFNWNLDLQLDGCPDALRTTRQSNGWSNNETWMYSRQLSSNMRCPAHPWQIWKWQSLHSPNLLLSGDIYFRIHSSSGTFQEDWEAVKTQHIAGSWDSGLFRPRILECRRSCTSHAPTYIYLRRPRKSHRRVQVNLCGIQSLSLAFRWHHCLTFFELDAH